MHKHTITGPPRPLSPEELHDPDAGQVMGPHGEAPEDPTERAAYRGCLMALLAIGIVLAIFGVIYRIYAA